MKTTLRKIKEKRLNDKSWTKLLKSLNKTKADDEPLSILHIIESNGIEDAIWCLRAVEGHDRTIRLFAVWCARQVQHLMEDPRSLKALDVAEAFANGLATEEELKAASSAAWDATRAASSATRAAASYAAWTTASYAAWTTESYAASSAAASAAAWTAAWAARENQKTKLLEILKETK